MTTTDNVRDPSQNRAGRLAGRAKGIVLDQIDQRSTEFGNALATHAQSIQTVGQTLREQGASAPAQLADVAAARLNEFSRYLCNTDGDRLVADAEALARRQPMLTLAAGIAVGTFAARLLKASATRRYETYVREPYPERFTQASYAGASSYYED